MIEVRPDDWREKLSIERDQRRAEIKLGYGTVRIIIPQHYIPELKNRLSLIEREIEQDREDREFDDYTA